jgi:hypothetical protein
VKTYIFVVLLVSFSMPCHAEWRERRSALPGMQQAGEFRIFYALSGPDALPDREDANGDGTPDYVERIAARLSTARDTYRRSMQLRDPLQSPRYRNEARFIDVHLLSFPLSPKGPRHGIAYDELSSFARPADVGSKVKVLVIDIANDLSSDNATPEHELFHLYQNGYTFYKNRWFTEGMARWIEHIDKTSSGPLPRSPADVQGLFSKTYETAAFWSAIAQRMDPAGGGRAFIKPFLEELGRMDDQRIGQWSEKDQMSVANDVLIWRALQNTLGQTAFRGRWDADIQRLMELRL